ncbi:phosphotransferase [Micromonospora sp. CPCC 206061]|uniref:phosphotransferase n=1 Tax=Micromonospora sp. CPCC 206061 TaxID=3122410 RepID=UPI002FF0A4AD
MTATQPALPLLGSGREADVYAIDDVRVLRRYRHGGDVTAEAAAMAYVGGLGYPVPRVYETRGADLVLERLSGATMSAAFQAGALGLDEGAAILADLHRRLHSLPPRFGRQENDRVIHLDLHPENVMLTPTGPMVIDWRNATEGPAEFDVAATAVILAQVALDPAMELAPAARALLTAFLGRMGEVPAEALDAAIARRARDPNMSADELDRLPAVAALVRVAC